MKVATILDQIDLGAMALPEFQRGYVWNRDQVRGLMLSLYRKHPVGGLLVWVTKTEGAQTRGDGKLAPGSIKLLLDGQQRVTSLYGLIRGKPPRFFDGNAQAFTGLFFNLEDQVFEFYAPTKMKDNPLWINVTELMKAGTGIAIQKLVTNASFAAKLTTYINRLTAIDTIKEIDLHMEEVAGEDKNVDVVVDIFNRVNSGGTKLSKGDLALARICAEWPSARDEMKRRLGKWRNAGFNFRLELLLRTTNAALTGESLFTALKDVSAEQFKDGLVNAEKHTDRLLNMIGSRLGLDHDRVLGSRYSFPLMARYLEQRGGKPLSAAERDKLLFWYVHTFLWGRYSGTTESTLSKDLALIKEVSPKGPGSGLEELVEGLRQSRGELKLTDADFSGFSKGNRFYPMLYMMTRVCRAKDWGTGDELSNHLLGHLSKLQLHHIHPKALLKKHGYNRREINAIANFTFLTQETNLEVTSRDPEEYIPAYEKKHKGLIGTHWIPMDPKLWKIENYRDFLAERRKLLAAAANEFLRKLHGGSVPDINKELPYAERIIEDRAVEIDDEDEERILRRVNRWLVKKGLPEGELNFELDGADTNAMLDLAWPRGLQEGLSEPVALLIGEGPEVEEAAGQAGFRYFTNARKFRGYVRKEILATGGDVEDSDDNGDEADGED